MIRSKYNKFYANRFNAIDAFEPLLRVGTVKRTRVSTLVLPITRRLWKSMIARLLRLAV